MNPENVGYHIPLRHSALWRKPLLYQKVQRLLPLCHLQLNQMGATGQSWRTRNNFVHKSPNSSVKSSNKNKAKQSNKLDNQTATFAPINPQADIKSKRLCESMVHLKSQGLSQAGKPVVAQYPAVGRFSWVMNDYHSKVSNQNFSRNEKGKYYTS